MLPVKMTADQRQRFKVACAEQDMTYAQLIESWLDRDARTLARKQAAQAHPLHRPTAVPVPETANQP